MEILKDSKGSSYINVGNIRISYIEQKNRSSLKDWPNADVIRIQAYTGKGHSLHKGAEYPIDSEKDIYVLFESISKLMSNK